MKTYNSLRVVLVIVALVAYIGFNLKVFFDSYQLLDPELKLPDSTTDISNTNLSYVSSLLTALVGSIVATGFGVVIPEASSGRIMASQPQLLTGRLNIKLQSLGQVALNDPTNENLKKSFGLIYALAYITIGIIASVMWVVLDTEATKTISNIATTFFGMLVGVVSLWFSK